MANSWYYQVAMTQFGPVDESEIIQRINDGTLSEEDLIREEGSDTWVSVASMVHYDETDDTEEQNDGDSSEVDSDNREPDHISDLSELSFAFEDAGQSNRRASKGSLGDSPDPSTLTSDQELLNSLAAQMTTEQQPEYYSQSLGQILGPMSMKDLLGMAESGALSDTDLVRRGENGQWKPASALSKLTQSLMKASEITSAPISNAPPSTRRLFQTAGKPAPDSTNAEEPTTTTTTSSEASEIVPGPLHIGNDDGKKERETAKTDSKTNTAKANPRKTALKKGMKAKSKKSDEDDKLLNEIFDDVFSDNEKSTHPSMPAAAKPAAMITEPRTAIDSKAKPITDSKSKSATDSATIKSNSPTKDTASGTAESPAVSATILPGRMAVSGDAEPKETPTGHPAPTLSSAPAAALITPQSAASPTPYVSPQPKRSLGISLSGPIKYVVLGIIGIGLVVGVVWQFGLPGFGESANTPHYASRMAAVMTEYKALGEKPDPGQWNEFSVKLRIEFVNSLKTMLDSGASGAKNAACMEGMKAIVAMAATKPEESDQRKALVARVEKSIAEMQ